MSRIRKKMDRWIARALDIPMDVTMSLPRMELIGNVQLRIENHKGVIHFTDQYLKLALSIGTLEVEGNNLSIRMIHTEELMVDGTIVNLKYTKD